MIKCRHLILLLSCLALQVLSHHDNVLQGPCAIFSCFGSSSDLSSEYQFPILMQHFRTFSKTLRQCLYQKGLAGIVTGHH
ncbi:hypothetical protein Y032_0118g736 [Ancylostoma ceylanicum]|uniref:Secreted protein n=1 Tax=Ancylostoma ceylanicum TaxID=53326 RepID=A0A016TBM9_9BILA|nr:hypothetical protein Y032_0118g736 [Ancylostoma ceylanicum]